MAQNLSLKQINQQLAPYSTPSIKKSLIESVGTLTIYLGLLSISIFLLKRGVSFLFILPFTFLSGLMMVRTFIIFHDACHGSLFKSQTLNKWLGRLTGLLTFTPFEEWRQAHNYHHASSGDLDRRGTGDVWTMTVSEYKKAPFLKRLAYHLYRNPLILFGLGPFFLFFISNRLPAKNSKKKVKRSVYLTDMAIVIFVLGFGFLIGFKELAMIFIPTLFFGGSIGIWLFYIQHQYENTYWSSNGEWDVIQASLKGSSYYQLPAFFHWLTGNIGYHHIHHLRSGIPFYNLPRCHQQVELFQQVKALTFKQSLKSVKLHLWDEQKEKLVPFKAVTNRVIPQT